MSGSDRSADFGSWDFPLTCCCVTLVIFEYRHRRPNFIYGCLSPAVSCFEYVASTMGRAGDAARVNIQADCSQCLITALVVSECYCCESCRIVHLFASQPISQCDRLFAFQRDMRSLQPLRAAG